MPVATKWAIYHSPDEDENGYVWIQYNYCKWGSHAHVMKTGTSFIAERGRGFIVAKLGC